MVGTLKRTVAEFSEDKLQHWAAALTYYAVLSIFPALLVMVSLVGLLADPERVTRVLTDTVSRSWALDGGGDLPGADRVDHLEPRRRRLGVHRRHRRALWSASGYVSAFAEACNSIYEVDEGRPFWKLKPLQLAITFVVIMLAALVALALVLSGPIVGALGSALGIGDTALTAWRFAKWPAMIAARPADLRRPLLHGPNARVSGVRWVTGGRAPGARRVGRRVGRVRGLRGELRLVRQDLRHARRRRRVPALAVDHEHGDPARRRAERRDRARAAASRRAQEKKP